jgi:hypothetical protein
MATTTPNYGWDVPTSTDYVKDGATAIETLGDDIDASMFSALLGKKASSVLIASGTFTGASTFDVSSCFTSTYKNYRIMINNDSSTTSDQVYFRWLTGTVTPDTNSIYFYSGSFAQTGGGSFAAITATADSKGHLGVNYSSGPDNLIDVEINSPNLAKRSGWIYRCIGPSATNGLQTFWGAGSTNSTTQYTGFRLVANSGTFTGSIAVYGYNTTV